MLATIEDKMEEVASTTPTEKENNMKEVTNDNIEDDFTYSYEQDPSFKTLMNNFDNSILIDTFQNQCLQFDTEKIMNVSPSFFYNDDLFNQSDYEITSKELYEKLVEDRIAFMNILLIDLSIYSNFSICGAQIFPNLKQTCMKLRDVTDIIEIKKELYDACYLVFEDQWDRKDNSTIIVFDDDGKSLFTKAFTEICIEGQWGREAFMLKDGILSFMKDYPMLCVSEDLNEDDEYDDDDDDDYYYNESLYHSIEDVNTFNEQYTNTIDNTFNNETNNDINTIINTDNIELTQLNNTEINDIDMTSPSQNQDNDVTMENTIPSNDNNNNDVSISIENETMDNTENISNNKSDADEQVSNELEKTDKNKEIDNLEANTNSMDYQTNDDDDEINQNKKNIDIDDPNINNDNINNMVMDESTFTNNNDSEGLKESTTTESEGNIETETKVSDTMACYDPRQMASVNVDTTNNKLLTNNQTEEITKLRKFQRYLIHNVWYAMDNSNDVPLMVCPPFLYLGSLYTSQEHHLINYNIKHVIRLGTDFNITYTDPSRFNFYNFDIFDLPKEPIKELFQKANDIIENARLNHENVLVHCHAGVSRSSTIILAYLMRYKGMSLYDAWCSTFKIRPIIRPNDGFAIALQEYEKILFNVDEPTMPVVGMSNSYLFSIEYFDFVSRLEEMHKLDPSVPVFRPEKTYEDLLKEVEEEEKEKVEEKEEKDIEKETETETEKITNNESTNETSNDNSSKDENINSEIAEDVKIDENKNNDNSSNDIKKEKDNQETEKTDFMDETENDKAFDLKKSSLAKEKIKDLNSLELDVTNDLKTREE
jgi:protein-tyrosine phosphatase